MGFQVTLRHRRSAERIREEDTSGADRGGSRRNHRTKQLLAKTTVRDVVLTRQVRYLWHLQHRLTWLLVNGVS